MLITYSFKVWGLFSYVNATLQQVQMLALELAKTIRKYYEEKYTQTITYVEERKDYPSGTCIV